MNSSPTRSAARPSSSSTASGSTRSAGELDRTLPPAGLRKSSPRAGPAWTAISHACARITRRSTTWKLGRGHRSVYEAIVRGLPEQTDHPWATRWAASSRRCCSAAWVRCGRRGHRSRPHQRRAEPAALSALRSAFPALKATGQQPSRGDARRCPRRSFTTRSRTTLDGRRGRRACTDRYTPSRTDGRVHVPGGARQLQPVGRDARRPPGSDGRAPLLLIAGGADPHRAPPSVTRAEGEAAGRSEALTAYKEFPGRSHFTVGQPGWEEGGRLRARSWALDPVEL